MLTAAAPMTSKTVAQLLADLGVAKSHSRPHVSNDNPYSEAQFKTLKYRPDYPDRFGSLEDARQWARSFFAWYNEQHHHIGLGLLTPAVVHTGRADDRPPTTPSRFAARLPDPSRTICARSAPANQVAGGGLDQSTSEHNRNVSTRTADRNDPGSRRTWRRSACAVNRSALHCCLRVGG